MKLISLFAAIFLLIPAFPANADVSESDLEELKGYTILGVWTVIGWRDPQDREKNGTSFDGCENDRIILLEGGNAVKCAEYAYAYAYRPKAVIFGDGTSLKMVLGGRIYRIRT